MFFVPLFLRYVYLNRITVLDGGFAVMLRVAWVALAVGLVGGFFASAFATVASFGTFTSCVLVLEMTGGHDAIFSLLLAAICAREHLG